MHFLFAIKLSDYSSHQVNSTQWIQRFYEVQSNNSRNYRRPKKKQMRPGLRELRTNQINEKFSRNKRHSCNTNDLLKFPWSRRRRRRRNKRRAINQTWRAIFPQAEEEKGQFSWKVYPARYKMR